MPGATGAMRQAGPECPTSLTIHSHAKAGILNRTMPKQAKNKSLIGVRATFQAANMGEIRKRPKFSSFLVIRTATCGSKALPNMVLHRDGSLFIRFPVISAIVQAATVIICQSQQRALVRPRSISRNGGKVTSHLVKYSHHTDGRRIFHRTARYSPRSNASPSRWTRSTANVFTPPSACAAGCGRPNKGCTHFCEAWRDRISN